MCRVLTTFRFDRLVLFLNITFKKKKKKECLPKFGVMVKIASFNKKMPKCFFQCVGLKRASFFSEKEHEIPMINLHLGVYTAMGNEQSSKKVTKRSFFFVPSF